MDDDESEDELVRFALRRKRRRAWAAGPRHGLVLTLGVRDAGEVQDEDGAATLIRYQAQKLKGLLPGIGRGNSVASSEASRKRREVIHPYPDGIYGHCCNIGSLGDADGFRQMTGFNKAEFDEFYAQTFWAAVPEDGEEPALLKRPWFFAQARNHLGAHSLEENEERRTLRGLLDDRDRVLCWLQMLRRDQQQFGQMEALYGPSKSTFHNDFKDMTAAAQNMPCLMMIEQRKAHQDMIGNMEEVVNSIREAAEKMGSRNSKLAEASLEQGREYARRVDEMDERDEARKAIRDAERKNRQQEFNARLDRAAAVAAKEHEELMTAMAMTSTTYPKLPHDAQLPWSTYAAFWLHVGNVDEDTQKVVTAEVPTIRELIDMARDKNFKEALKELRIPAFVAYRIANLIHVNVYGRQVAGKCCGGVGACDPVAGVMSCACCKRA
eukprot:jgi/Undpi1/6919/HiC_scaffold_21.g09394.m1